MTLADIAVEQAAALADEALDIGRRCVLATLLVRSRLHLVDDAFHGQEVGEVPTCVRQYRWHCVSPENPPPVTAVPQLLHAGRA